MTLHKSVTNLTLQFNIMVLSKPHFNKFSLANSCTAYSLPPHMILSGMNVTALLNLSVTDMTVLKISIEIESSRIKLRLIM